MKKKKSQKIILEEIYFSHERKIGFSFLSFSLWVFHREPKKKSKERKIIDNQSFHFY